MGGYYTLLQWCSRMVVWGNMKLKALKLWGCRHVIGQSGVVQLVLFSPNVTNRLLDCPGRVLYVYSSIVSK